MEIYFQVSVLQVLSIPLKNEKKIEKMKKISMLQLIRSKKRYEEEEEKKIFIYSCVLCLTVNYCIGCRIPPNRHIEMRSSIERVYIFYGGSNENLFCSFSSPVLRVDNDNISRANVCGRGSGFCLSKDRRTSYRSIPSTFCFTFCR